MGNLHRRSPWIDASRPTSGVLLLRVTSALGEVAHLRLMSADAEEVINHSRRRQTAALEAGHMTSEQTFGHQQKFLLTV